MTALQELNKMQGQQGGTIHQHIRSLKVDKVKKNNAVYFSLGKLSGVLSIYGSVSFSNWRGNYGQDHPTGQVSHWIKMLLADKVKLNNQQF